MATTIDEIDEVILLLEDHVSLLKKEAQLKKQSSTLATIYTRLTPHVNLFEDLEKLKIKIGKGHYQEAYRFINKISKTHLQGSTQECLLKVTHQLENILWILAKPYQNKEPIEREKFSAIFEKADLSQQKIILANIPSQNDLEALEKNYQNLRDKTKNPIDQTKYEKLLKLIEDRIGTLTLLKNFSKLCQGEDATYKEKFVRALLKESIKKQKEILAKQSDTALDELTQIINTFALEATKHKKIEEIAQCNKLRLQLAFEKQSKLLLSPFDKISRSRQAEFISQLSLLKLDQQQKVLAKQPISALEQIREVYQALITSSQRQNQAKYKKQFNFLSHLLKKREHLVNGILKMPYAAGSLVERFTFCHALESLPAKSQIVILKHQSADDLKRLNENYQKLLHHHSATTEDRIKYNSLIVKISQEIKLRAQDAVHQNAHGRISRKQF